MDKEAEYEEQAEKGKVEEVVEERIAETLESMPEPDEPKVELSATEERLSRIEEKLAAMYVEMGGIVNRGSMTEPVSEDKPEPYIPLNELDYKI